MDHERVALGGRLAPRLRGARVPVGARSRSSALRPIGSGSELHRESGASCGSETNGGGAVVDPDASAPLPLGEDGMLTPVERVLILKGVDLLKDVGPRHLLGLANVAREVEIFD